jgi:glycerol-3-phosphate acyltransferase PlsY
MLSILLGYLAGSVPFAFLLARRAGIDVRLAGSGNVGAANVLRTTGRGRAIAVMALDVAKGAAAGRRRRGRRAHLPDLAPVPRW